MSSFLKRHYLDDAKLAQRALLEFHRALTSGRLIAFTGSMTTRPCGYGSWSELRDIYARLAEIAAHPDHPPADVWKRLEERLAAVRDGQAATPMPPEDGKIEGIRRYSEKNDRYDVRVALGLFEEIVVGRDTAQSGVLNYASEWELDTARTRLNLLSVAMAHYFRKPHHPPLTGSDRDILAAMLKSIGPRRVVTTNYDFELEGRLMVPDVNGDDPPFEKLRKLYADAQDGFAWNLESGRIRRVLANGQAVESDILHRERIDRMLEFAIGADDVDHHILHLHGRACNAESMILSYRDYDRLYRRNDLSKLPFEFAQRIMMGGNPILFVGLGMGEAELNSVLQDFVSSNPYRRVAPTFLLWNTRPEDRERVNGVSPMEMRRLDWLHRLGVLAIFDADLPGVGANQVLGDEEKLVRLIKALPDHAARIGAREAYRGGKHWRHMGVKVEPADAPVILWEVTERSIGHTDRAKVHEDGLQSLQGRMGDARLVCILSLQGCGKGSFAYHVATHSQELGVAPSDTLLINGAFCFDTDSLLDGIARFLDARAEKVYSSGRLDGAPTKSRSEFFKTLANRIYFPVLIVINGAERFFGLAGDLLSAELDEFIRLVSRGELPNVRLLMFGTDRLARYMAEQSSARVLRGNDIGLSLAADGERLPMQRLEAIRNAYAAAGVDAAAVAPAKHRELEKAQGHRRANLAARISGDDLQLRSAFFDLYLYPDMLDGALANCATGLSQEKFRGLVQEIIRALAFIGLPAESGVIAHVPRIRNLFSDGDPRATQGFVDAGLRRLTELGLVLELTGYSGAKGESGPDPRYALPRLLSSEIRARFSIPLSEAKLSTAFNMALYVAQPVDGYIPEPDIHDELGTMIDRLLGAYRDLARECAEPLPASARAAMAPVVQRTMPHEHRQIATPTAATSGRDMVSEMAMLAGASSIQCLRAALALMRGYYTTSDLLTLDVGDRLIREDRDGILLEHAERLDTLIDAYGKVAMAREELRAAFAMEADLDFEALFGAIEPLYPDELVWLHNERGVVRLAMGDLIEARVSFLRALDVNTEHVERGDRSHNWRRIRLNQLTVDLESGDIALAMRKIEEILTVTRETAPDPAREDLLAMALAKGYRGWALSLQGENAKALRDYSAAIDTLEKIGEIRAQAYFRRLRATALPAGHDGPRKQEIAASLHLALSARQMDLVYRLRIMEADDILTAADSDGKERERARRLLDDTMRYSLQTDLHRVRVEAGAALASGRAVSGDFEGALRDVSDAVMVATRFSMELQKIVLRSSMAGIMAARGHPITASRLAAAAIRIGSRRRYHAAIAEAEKTLAGIPRISAITDVLDTAIRR